MGGLGGPNRESMEAIRYLFALARERPSRIILALDDSVFAVTASPGIRVALRMDGGERQLPDAPWPTEARVAWDDLQPRLEREIEDGGRIVDHFEAMNGTRLILTRTVESGRTGERRMVFVYDRAGG
jgi:hypothetical protein